MQLLNYCYLCHVFDFFSCVRGKSDCFFFLLYFLGLLYPNLEFSGGANLEDSGIQYLRDHNHWK